MRKTKTLDKVQYPAPDVTTKVIPAPTEGWDAISPLADMSPQRAVIMDNFVPRPGFIETRRGYQAFVTTTLASEIQTLMVYQKPDNTVKMYAATAAGSLLDVTTSATVATVAATVYTTGRWQWTNYTPSGAATVLQFVNGTDSLQQVSGTVISSVSITNLSILPGTVTTANFINIAAVKRRLWYVIKNSTIATFLATDAIQGPVAGFLDLGALWSKGGNLVAMGIWTIDGGSGPDDYTVFMSDQGQISIYNGTDPTTSTWSLKGTFDISPPIGRRSLRRFGSDLLIITHQGVLPISQTLPFDPSADRSSAITSRIQNAMIQAAASFGDIFGWEITSFPIQALLILNVPGSPEGASLYQQFVMNTVTGAWCRFTGWNAATFAVMNDVLYFGDTSGNVKKAYVGGIDGTAGITGTLQCAFNWYETPGRLKRMTFIQPLLTLIDGGLFPTLTVDVDFSNTTAVTSIQTAIASAQWDVSLWDVGMWGGPVSVIPWLSVNALGKALAVRVSLFYSTDIIDNDSTCKINAFNTIVEMGGMI